MEPMRVFTHAIRATLACALVAVVMPVHRVISQPAPHLRHARARVLVAGQPDSASLALTEAVRQQLQRKAPSLLMIPQAAFDEVLVQGFRAREDHIEFSDMREIGLLVRANLVVGLMPDSAQKNWLDVFILSPPSRTRRELGRLSAKRGSATAIAKLIEADSAYLRLRRL
jgi:hypothetical protein